MIIAELRQPEATKQSPILTWERRGNPFSLVTRQPYWICCMYFRHEIEAMCVLSLSLQLNRT